MSETRIDADAATPSRACTPLREACERLNGAAPFPDAEMEALLTCTALLKVLEGSEHVIVPGFDRVLRAQRSRFLRELARRAGQIGDGVDGAGAVLPVPRVDAATLTAGDFVSYLKAPVPVVLSGAALGTRAVATWTPEYFKQHYADFKCAAQIGDDHGVVASIGQIVDEVLSGTEAGTYVHNVADFFTVHPEEEAALELERVVGGFLDGQLFGTQLFLGGRRTGTRFHASNNFNAFVNVFGEKEWVFAHPRHTPWMYGELDSTGIYALSPVDHNQRAELQEDWPLYRQIPTYRVILQPGDVLLNPNWWWHAVNNPSAGSIACATRWMVPGSLKTHFAFGLSQQLLPHYRGLIEEMFADPTGFRIEDESFRRTYGARS